MEVSLVGFRTIAMEEIGCAHVVIDWKSQNRPEENEATKKPVLVTQCIHTQSRKYWASPFKKYQHEYSGRAMCWRMLTCPRKVLEVFHPDVNAALHLASGLTLVLSQMPRPCTHLLLQ